MRRGRSTTPIAQGYVAKGRPAPAADRFGYLGLVAVAANERRRASAASWSPLSALDRHRRAAVPQSARLSLGRGQCRHPERRDAASAAITKDGRVIDMRTGSVQDLIDAGIMFCGTPDQVYDQIVDFGEYCGGMGNLLMMGHAGCHVARGHGRQSDAVRDTRCCRGCGTTSSRARRRRRRREVWGVSQIRDEPPGEQHQDPAHQRDRRERAAPSGGSSALRRRPKRQWKTATLMRPSANIAILNWKAGLSTTGRGVGRQQHEAGHELERKPERGDRQWRRGRACDACRRGAAPGCRTPRWRPPATPRPAHGQVRERIEPGRAARRDAEARLLVAPSWPLGEGCRRASAQRSSTVLPRDGDALGAHLVFVAGRRIAFHHHLGSGFQHLLRTGRAPACGTAAPASPPRCRPDTSA